MSLFDSSHREFMKVRFVHGRRISIVFLLHLTLINIEQTSAFLEELACLQ